MTERARGAVDGREIFVGDTVMIRAIVLQSVAGVGAEVEMFSKTDQYSAWVREEDLRWAVVQEDLPPEPADDTWLMVHDEEGMCLIFHRDDAEGHNDRDNRRYDRHWWDVTEKQWIDWPTAVSRGAARHDVRRMNVEDEFV